MNVMAKQQKLPINEFMSLTENKRGGEIADNMQLLRELFPIDHEWISASFNRVPKNQQETLYVAYLIGASMQKPDIQAREFLVS